MEEILAEEVAELNLCKPVKIGKSGDTFGSICGYHSKMNRIIIGLHSKIGWQFKCADDGVLIYSGFTSYLYVEVEDVV